jgi:hypothetical protein
MKPTFIKPIFIIAVIGFFMSSCKKDLPIANDNGPEIQPPYVYNLMAEHWVREVNGFYSNRFHGLLALASNGSNGSSVAKVYLVTTNGEIQINHFIFFMGGELWAATTPPDLIIYFRYSSNALPFSFLQIKLVVE